MLSKQTNDDLINMRLQINKSVTPAPVQPPAAHTPAAATAPVQPPTARAPAAATAPLQPPVVGASAAATAPVQPPAVRAPAPDTAPVQHSAARAPVPTTAPPVVGESAAAIAPVQLNTRAITNTRVPAVEPPPSASAPPTIRAPTPSSGNADTPSSTRAVSGWRESDDPSSPDDDDVVPSPPQEFSSFEEMSMAKKRVWRNAKGVLDLMTDYLTDLPQAEWSMKRLLKRMVETHDVDHRRNDGKRVLGRAMDFWISSKLNGAELVCKTKQRWSAKLDSTRLLQLMFDTPAAQATYLQSKKLPDRARLDDTSKLS